MREISFDIMKGIGIIAMIIGHCPIPDVLKSFIFTWHMPLFFIIAGYFFHPTNIRKAFLKNIQSLIIPYFITALLLLCCSFVYYLYGASNLEQLKNAFGAVIIGAGSKSLPNLSDFFIGALWFLQALFWCRIVFNLIYLHVSGINRVILILFFSFASTLTSSYIYIPTNLLQGLSALLFYEIGYQISTNAVLKNKTNIVILILTILSVFISISIGSMSMARCFYSFYPINVLSAYLVFIICFSVAEFFSKKELPGSMQLSQIGRLSLLILCVHNIDVNSGFYNYLNSGFFHFVGGINSLVLIIWRLSFAIIMAYVLSHFKAIRLMFRLN